MMPSSSPTRIRIARRLGPARLRRRRLLAGGRRRRDLLLGHGPNLRASGKAPTACVGGLRGVGLGDVAPERDLGDEDVLAGPAAPRGSGGRSRCRGTAPTSGAARTPGAARRARRRRRAPPGPRSSGRAAGRASGTATRRRRAARPAAGGRSARGSRSRPSASSVTWTAVTTSAIVRPNRIAVTTSRVTSDAGTKTRCRRRGGPMIASGRTCVSRRRRRYCRPMNSIPATSSGMTMMISQAPSANFATAKITATIPVETAPTPLMTALRRQPRRPRRSPARRASGGPCPPATA